jgi:signal transduction histidine kinase/DNA-binding response OmpR family regulator
MPSVPLPRRLFEFWFHLSLPVKGGAIVAVPVLCTLAMLLLIADLQRKIEAANGWVLHTEQVLAESGGLLSSAMSAEATARGYMLAGDPAFLELNRTARRAVERRLQSTIQLTADNPAQQTRIRHAGEVVERELDALDRQLAGRQPEPNPSFAPVVQASRQRMDELRREIAAFQQEEQRLLDAREEQSERRRNTLRLALWSFGAAGALAGAFAAVLFVNGVSRRLNRIAKNAERYSRRESSGPVDGSADALGRLEGTLIATTAGLLDREQRLVENAAELERAKEAAEQATRAKSDFVSTVSHDIRSPMNAILGTAELLAKTPLDATQAEYVQILNRAGNTLLAVVNEVLDISKLEAGRLELESVPFDCAAAMKKVVDLLSMQVGGKALELKLEYAADAPRRVTGDPNRLERVLLNLGTNAVKFTPAGRVTFAVERGSEADVLHFRVTDTGIGIAADRQEAIFQKFTQAEVSTTRRFGGTGLGLAIAKQIVELMGGRIRVESAPGQGSTFHFTARMPAASAPLPAADRGEEPRGPRQIGARILLAEDSPTSAALVRAYLAGTGCTLEWVADGESALRQLTDQASHFHLALMDVQMPGLDGYAATRQFRDWERAHGRARTPVVALTAHAFEEDVDRAIQSGADGHLTKPIRRETLLDAVDWYRRRDGIDEMRVAVPAFIRELAPEFLRRQRLGLFAAATALKNGDFAAIQSFAHNMKGCGRSFGFPKLTEWGRDMERAAKDRDAASLDRQTVEVRDYLAAVEVA